jgi:Ca2+-binding RTX toxin-like protein
MRTDSILVVARATATPKPVNGTNAEDRMNGTAKNDFLRGLEADDRMNGDDGHDMLYGGRGDDRIDGGEGNDSIRGGSGHDRIDGEEGNDFLYGGYGDDILNGGSGNDYLRCHSGVDIMTGGLGADRFVFSQAKFAVTTIEDFQQGFDRLVYFIDGKTAGTLAGFRAGATQQGADTVFERDNIRLILLNVDLKDITAADFYTYL